MAELSTKGKTRRTPEGLLSEAYTRRRFRKMRSSKRKVSYTNLFEGAVWIVDHYKKGSKYKSEKKKKRVKRLGRNGQREDHEKITIPELIRETYNMLGQGKYDARESYSAVKRSLNQLKEVERNLRELKDFVEAEIAAGKKIKEIQVPKLKHCSLHRDPKKIKKMLAQIPRIHKEFKSMVLEFNLARKNRNGRLVFDSWAVTQQRIRQLYESDKKAFKAKLLVPTPPARG